MNVGYVGSGPLALAAVRRLNEQHAVLVFSPGKDRALEDTRAASVKDLAELVRSSDVLMICLHSQSEVREVLLGSKLEDALAPGRIIIDQTSGDPDQTRAMAEELRKRGVVLLDAPIHCELVDSMPEASAILCGGPRDAVDSVRPLLEAICPKVVYCGDTGSGHAARLVVAAVAACNRLITYECATVGVKNGLAIEHMAAVLNKSSGFNSATARILPVLATAARTTDVSLAAIAEELALASRLAMRAGAPMLVANLACAMVESAAAQLGATATLDALAGTFEVTAGIHFRDAITRTSTD